MLLYFLGIKKVVVLLFQKVIHACELGNVPYKLDTDYNHIIKRNNGSHVICAAAWTGHFLPPNAHLSMPVFLPYRAWSIYTLSKGGGSNFNFWVLFEK